MEERVNWKDIFCGLGIILIYLGHLGNTGVGNIRPFIGLFANPIFFCAGGVFHPEIYGEKNIWTMVEA